jgi:nicotinamide mononucleotide transporter
MKVFLYALAFLASAGLMALSYWPKAHIMPTEAFGFVTGAWCVWLAVREHIWNWPIGVASSVFYVILFLNNRLFGDMGLQVVYIALGILGWYWWLRGGQNQSRLAVSRTTKHTAAWLIIFVIACTIGMTFYFRHIQDSAPFLDAFTTALSLAAQYQITKKLFENWYVWIVADVIYVGLYIYKDLYLTAGLYGIFIVMCIFGLRDWRRSMTHSKATDADNTKPVFESEGVWPPPIKTTRPDEPLEVPHG